MMQLREQNAEVLYNTAGSVIVSRPDIEELKERASRNSRRRIRLCAHLDMEDKVHEMLIVHMSDTYVRPHKHMDKGESIHVIEGTFDLIMFDESGNITEIKPMGDYSSGRFFFHRITEPRYHTLLISSDYLVFHETADGPFRASDTVFAPWAPDQADDLGGAEYMQKLGAAMTRFSGQ